MKTSLSGSWLSGLIVFACAASPALAVTFTNDITIGIGDTTYDGADVVVSNCTVTIDGLHSFASLQVASGGRVTHSGADVIAAAHLDLTITGALEVRASGAITANGKGYGAGAGPGRGGSSLDGTSGAGGGYGGCGGISSSNAIGGGGYGSFEAPFDLGSPGGAGYAGQGGNGGGAIRIAAEPIYRP